MNLFPILILQLPKHEIELQNSLNHGCVYGSTLNSNIDNKIMLKNDGTTQNHACMYA